MKPVATLLSILVVVQACGQARMQLRQVGGGCENCELMFEAMPASLSHETRIAPADEPGEAVMITGVVFRPDRKTPAEGVTLYFYHTDHQGLYSRGTGKGEQTVHGRLRGWVRTDRSGRYSIRTIRPASYPNSRTPQHIHVIVKEDGLHPYWIDEYQFDDDPFVDDTVRASQGNRGGPGIITLTQSGDLWMGNRDIVLGLHVPGY